MKTNILLVILTMSLLLCSCDHKDLDFSGTADLTVDFDWSNVPNATPSSMVLATFSSTSQPIHKHMQGKQGSTIMLPEGHYSLISYNGDTDFFATRGATWQDYEIYALPTELYQVSRMFANTRAVPKGSGTEDQPFINEPEELWTAANKDIEINGHIGQRVTMQMEAATFEMQFTIKNVQNIEYISDMLATISGMSGSWFPGQHRCSERLCIIPFELSSDGKSFEGTVRTFGYMEDNKPDHKLVIYSEMTDGSKLYYTFDVSDAINEAKHGQNEKVYVELEELPLPKPMGNGAGLQPDVTDWEEVLIPLPM